MSFKTRGEIQGDASIIIERDAHGIPHVLASSDADGYRGLGYCHGADRGLQMLMLRVLVQGRGCELLTDSDEMLAIDRFFRRMDFGREAAAERDKLPANWQALLEAYVAGVNQAFEASLPWELRLLPYKHTPWETGDSLALTRLMAYVNLAQSQGDMERLLVEMVQGGVPTGHLDELFPGLLGDLDPYLLKRVRLGERVVPEALSWLSAVPKAMASNNWVVAGAKTASGAPLLANDPHLEINRLPAVWYEVVLELPDRFCIAATMPGLPAALLGRTNELAWGVTYAFMDGIDNWIEDCREGTYRRNEAGKEEWLPFRERRELIKRRKHDDVEVVFYENDHGVLDGDPHEAGLYLSTCWASSSGTGAISVAAIMGMLRAKTVQQGMKLIGHVETAWNWVLADKQGNIGYQMSGRMPERAPGHDGFVPLEGWNPGNDWRGFVPVDRLPWSINPDTGYIVTANNDLNAFGRCRPINLPMAPFRANTIAQALASRDDWDVAQTAKLQLDVGSPHALNYMAILRPLLTDKGNEKLLADWDGCYDAQSRGAWLFERFYEALLRDVFGSVMGPEVIGHLLGESGIIADFAWNLDRVLLDARSVWYGGRQRDEVWRAVAAHALAGEAQTWGSSRQLLMGHLLFGGKLPLFLGFDYGPITLEGGRATVRQGQLYRSGGRQTSFAPSYRVVVDFSEDVAHTALAGGVSDRRFSGLYSSDIDNWSQGRLKRVERLRPAVEKPPESVQ